MSDFFAGRDQRAVADALERAGLAAEYQQIFLDNEIDVESFSLMTRQDLIDLNVTKKGPQMKLLKLVESAAEYVRGSNVASVASPGGGLWDGAGRSSGVVGTISNTSSATDAVVLGSLSSSGGSPNDQQRDGYSSALGMLRSTEDLRMPSATTAVPIAGSSSGAFLSVPLAGSPLLVEDSATLMRDWFGDHAIGAFTPSLTSPYSEVFGAASAAAGPENAALLSTTVGMALEQSNNSLGAAHQLRASTGPGTAAAAGANPAAAAVAAAAAAAAASVGAALVGTTLFVFGIPAAAMIDLGRIRDFLRQHFERFGQLANVEVTHGTNGWPSSALVEFAHKDSASACMREVDAGLPSGKIIVDGHSLVIRWWQAAPARFDGDNNAVYSPRAGDDAKSPPQQTQQQQQQQQQQNAQQQQQSAPTAPQSAPATQQPQQKPTLASHLAMAKKAGLNGSSGEGSNAPLLAAPPVAVPPSPSAGSNGASNAAAADGDDEDDGDSQQTDSLNNSTDFVGELDGSGGAGFAYNGEAFSNASTDFTQGPPHLRRRRALQQLFNELVRRDAHCAPHHHPCSAMAAKRIFAECTGLSFEDALQLQFFDVVKAIEACPDLFSISYVPDGREGINEKKWRFRANGPVKPRKPSTRVRSSVQSKTGGNGSKAAGSGGANGGSGGAGGGGGGGGKQQPAKQREPWE